MGGFFGTVQKQPCATDLFYGTDYQSHLGTKRGGMATLSDAGEFLRSIHNLESRSSTSSKARQASASSATPTRNPC